MDGLTFSPLFLYSISIKFLLRIRQRLYFPFLYSTAMQFSANSTNTVLDPKTTKKKYPQARIIVLDDNFNTFEHVANCLVTIIPGMSKKRSWLLAVEVDREGFAEVWRGPLEQAELYHQQLVSKGLTMAPIEQT